MASDYLLEIDGIKGEAKDAKLKETIEIDSYSVGASHSGSFSRGTGGATGKASFQDMHCSTKVNKASPNIFNHCAIGKHAKKAILHCRKATGDGGQQEYLTITLEDVMVSSYQCGGHAGGGDSIPGDQFSISFAKINFEYKPQKDDGTLDAGVTFKYDLQQQQA
jgi:type VI secretion system secreted protein Hcp